MMAKKPRRRPPPPPVPNDWMWTCHICGELREDEKISVRTTDLSEERGLQPGVLKQNVRYCNDREGCVEKSKTHRLL